MKRIPSKTGSFFASLIKLKWSIVLVIIFLIYFLIVFIFALIYHCFDLVSDTSDFLTNFYFSIVTQTTLGYGDFKPNQTPLAQITVIIHTALGLFYFVISTAVIIFKFLRAPRKAFIFDKNAVFYPREETLRFRVYSRSYFPTTNVKFDCFLRRWARNGVPHPHYTFSDICMDRGTIPIMKPMDPWLIKTIPGMKGEITFKPSIINETDELVLCFRGEILDLKDNIIGTHTYKANDIKCGMFKLIDTEGLGPEKWRDFDWTKWNEWESVSPSQCKACKYYNDCKITKKTSEKIERKE